MYILYIYIYIPHQISPRYPHMAGCINAFFIVPVTSITVNYNCSSNMYLHIPPVNPHVRMIVRSISTLLFYTLRSPTFPVRPAQEIGGLRDTPKSLNRWDFMCIYKSTYVLILCKYYIYIYIYTQKLENPCEVSNVAWDFLPWGSNFDHPTVDISSKISSFTELPNQLTYLGGARLVWVCLKIMWTFPRCLRIMI